MVWYLKMMKNCCSNTESFAKKAQLVLDCCWGAPTVVRSLILHALGGQYQKCRICLIYHNRVEHKHRHCTCTMHTQLFFQQYNKLTLLKGRKVWILKKGLLFRGQMNIERVKKLNSSSIHYVLNNKNGVFKSLGMILIFL